MKTHIVDAHSGPTRRQFLAGSVMTLGAAWAGAQAPSKSEGASKDEVSRSAETIHQEPFYAADRKRIYDALTVAEKFDEIITLSGFRDSASKSANQAPTRIDGHAGGAFALFGGYIVGRQVELIPNELIVQAWRVENWARGVYSMAKFELTEVSGGTKVLFDHTGFPLGLGEHLASGWHDHYWDPMTKFLAASTKS